MENALAAAPSVTVLRDWPLLLTKLLRPLLPEHYLRREQLERRFAQHKGHWCIYGSAGYGKTTLASAYCDWVHAEVGWLSLDVEDNTSERFALYLAAAFVLAHPKASERFSASVHSQQSLQLAQVVTAILNDALLAQQPIVLVLDDYHLIEEKTIHDHVSLLLTRASPNLQVLILSRTVAPLAISALQMQNRIKTLNTSDLAFDTACCISYMGKTCPEVDNTKISPLLNAIEGWPAGLRSLALFLAGSPAAAATISSDTLITSGMITDYLWEHVLGKLSPELQQFLLKTSLLGTFDAELGAALTGQKNSAALIEESLRRQLFIVALDPEHRWYRYHNLFQTFLSRRLQENSAEEFERLHRRAAEFWLERNDVAKTLRHALAINAIELIVDALNNPHEALLKQGNRALLERAILSLSEDIICLHPRIMMLACRYWMVRNKDKVLPLLDKVSSKINTVANQAHLRHMRALLELYRAQVAFGREQLDLGIDCAQRALDDLPETDFRSHSEAWALLAEANTRVGNLDTARAQWILGEQLALQADTPSQVVWSRHQLAMMEQGLGSFALAQSLQDQAIAYGERYCIDGAHSLWCLYRARTDTAWEYFNLDDVETYCEKALRLSEHWFHDGTLPILITKARTQLLLGNQAEARELLLQAETVLKTSRHHSYVRSYLDLAKTEFHLRYSPASALSQLAQTLPTPTRYDNEIAQRQGRALAICRLGQGDTESAVTLLWEMCEFATRAQLLTEKWRNHIWLAVCQQQLGQLELAEATLKDCLQFAADQALIGSLLIAAPQMETLLTRDIALNDIQKRHLRRLRDLLGHSRAHTHRGQNVPAAITALAITPRDWRVFELLLGGASNEEISEQLHLALGTVKNTITRIYRKLDVTDREAACQVGNSLLR